MDKISCTFEMILFNYGVFAIPIHAGNCTSTVFLKRGDLMLLLTLLAACIYIYITCTFGWDACLEIGA